MRNLLRGAGGVARTAVAPHTARASDGHAQIDPCVRRKVDLRETAVEPVEARVVRAVGGAVRNHQVKVRPNAANGSATTKRRAADVDVTDRGRHVAIGPHAAEVGVVEVSIEELEVER